MEVENQGELPEFKIVEWNAVAVWSFNNDTDTCAICRCKLLGQCLDCQSKPVGSISSPKSECKVWISSTFLIIVFLSVFDSRQCVLLNCVSCTNGSLHRLLGESAAMVFTNIVSVVGWQRRRTAPSTWRSGTSPTQRSCNRLRCRSASHDYITFFLFNFDYPLYASSTLFVF